MPTKCSDSTPSRYQPDSDAPRLQLSEKACISMRNNTWAFFIDENLHHPLNALEEHLAKELMRERGLLPDEPESSPSLD